MPPRLFTANTTLIGEEIPAAGGEPKTCIRALIEKVEVAPPVLWAHVSAHEFVDPAFDDGWVEGLD
jgi:hypothetical protein